MDSIKFPTFTIATNKCCSMILPFSDIAAALEDEPHIIQVGIGELSKNFYQIKDLKLNWLHSPANWPVYVSGFNPGIHPHSPQVFQYDLNKKKIQVTNGTARESLTHAEMAQMVSTASNPKIDIVSLPCEEGEDREDDSVIEPVTKKPKHEGKEKKLKRKQNRRHQSFVDAIAAMNSLDKRLVCPIVDRDQDLTNLGDTVKFLGCSGTMTHRSSHSDLPGLRFVRVHNQESNEATLKEIRTLLASKTVDVVETDFPFKLAREGVLIDSEFNLVDMKSKDKFNDHSDLLEFSHHVPESVREAGAHMRSYIHHLFRCDELSGPILLATVNLYQFEKLFRSH